MSRARDVMRRMRRDLHLDRAIPALYLATPTAVPLLCTVRVHDRFDSPGQLAGAKGDATFQDIAPKIVFIVDDAPLKIRVGAVVSVEVGEAYRIVNTQPAHDITISAEVTRLSAAEAAGLLVPALV